MVSASLGEVLIGVYLGLLAGIFPAFIAFAIGFGFKYFTNVTVPGLGVVVLGGALAGISGGLMALSDPDLAGSWTGTTAILVILMATLWAHSVGDKLGAATPRRFTLKTLREARLSADIAERVDSYGQIRIRPIGGIRDIEGYPPLPDDLREKLDAGSWKFPATHTLSELEDRLEEQLTTEYELAAVEVTVGKQGRAQIAAAPSAAGLSRRVPDGRRAVSIRTLLPTGVTRGDIVSVRLPDGTVTGPVVSARTTETARNVEPDDATAANEATPDGAGEAAQPKPTAPTTTGGEGEVTIAVNLAEARRIIRADFAPITVHSRGKQREYEAIGVLKQHGNHFRRLIVGEGSPLAGCTIGDAQIRDSYGVAVLAIRRAAERIIAPRGAAVLHAGDVLIVVGRRDQLQTFEEVVA